MLKQFFWPIEQAQQHKERLTWPGEGLPLLHSKALPQTHVNASREGERVEAGRGASKSNIIDRCTERSLATVAAGANPIKIGSVYVSGCDGGLSTCACTHSQFTMGTHSCMRAFIWPTSRLSVNQRHRQSRDRDREGRGRRSNPQAVANAARCSMIFKKFLFIYKTRAGAGGGGGGKRGSSTTGAQAKQFLAASQVDSKKC